MKKAIFIVFILLLGLTLLYAQDTNLKVLLLIAEQNIEGPQNAWWLSEIDLSTSEAAIARRLIAQGYAVLEPASTNKIIQQNRAFRVISLSEEESIKLGSLSQADYVVLGKAIASAGANVPQSNMRSCFANLSAKIIRVKDGRVIAYPESSGNSAHLDVITGGKEALANAGDDLATKIIEVLNKEGGK